jgi:glutamate/aspartate transport system permease protein
MLKDFPSYLLVSIALGFFTSARIAEQVRAGIQSLPSGQKAAATALGLTTLQSYRYIILPMALRIVIPPLTSESMNLIKNSSVAFAVSVPELTLFAMQAQEETSRGVEIYLAVTLLYALSAFAVNRVMAYIEKRSRVPGFIVASTEAVAH